MSAVMNGPLHRGGAGNRALHYAVAASLVFHAAVLFVMSLERHAKRESATPGPIVARLVAPPVAAPQPVAPQPEPPKPRVEDPPPKPAVKPVVKPVPVQKQSPIPVPVQKESQPTAPSAPPQPAAPSVAAPAPAAPAPPPSAPVAGVDPQPSPPSSDAGTLEKYRIDLMSEAKRYKRYPRVALDNNWEGRVVVRMVVGANGMISAISVITTAGHEVLDKQALDMIQKAKPRVQIPAALRGREFTIEIPVIYSLKDQDSG